VTETDEPVRVLLVEDSDVYRESLVYLLRTRGDVEVVAAVADGASAVRACRELEPDVVVLDYRLPDIDGVETALGIRAACPDASILALTAAAEGPQVDALLAAGAVACLTKDRELDEIVAAVRGAHRGNVEAR
jgi:DNA-binding NarL/FixJ family response regulator